MAALVGQTVSHYRILEKLGGGGMGVVYKARDLKLDRPVALKFLPPSLIRDSDAKQRFIHEAKAASALQHGNICVVYEIDDTDDEKMFISMEYLEGETLNKKIARGPLKIDEAVEIAIQVARGLAKAHEHGIIHRDVKPANIVITRDGGVKIVDFGLAKLSGLSLLTKRGSTMGTVAYMSPEQARSSEVDHRTDIWSLGVMLYEMLAGRRPFRSDYEQALIYSIINEEPPPLSSFRKDLPEHLVTLCARCLAKDSESRPPSMDEVVALLRAGSGPAAPRDRSGVARMKRQKVAAIAGSAFVVIVAASLVFTLRSNSPLVLPGNAVLGILQFENQTGDTATAAWPTFIQWRIFDNFAGRRHLAVYYPVTVNDMAERVAARPGTTREEMLRELFASTPITLIVDGILRKSVQGFRLDLRLAGVDRGTLYSASGDVPDGRQLANAVDTLSRQLAALLPQGDQPEAGEGGAEQWRPPKIHLIPAVMAFDLGALGGQRADTESIVYLEDAIQIDWAYIAPRALLICRLMGRGSADLAREHLRVLTRLRNLANPYEQSLIDWARATVEQDIEAQIRATELLLEYSPGDRILLYVLARLKYLQLDFHGCVETLQPALQTGSRYSPMHYLLGSSYEQLGKPGAARRILEQGLSFEPVYPEIYSLLSAMCRRDGDSLAGARYETAYLQATRERATSPGSSYASLARLCLDRGQDEEASRLFSLAVREAPDSPRFHEGWAEALLYLGDTLAALGQFRRTLVLDPRSPGALYRLGAIFEYQGKRRESLRYTELYLRTDSAGRHATEARARLKRQKE